MRYIPALFSADIYREPQPWWRISMTRYGVKVELCDFGARCGGSANTEVEGERALLRWPLGVVWVLACSPTGRRLLH